MTPLSLKHYHGNWPLTRRLLVVIVGTDEDFVDWLLIARE
jgi:hypothetical protein